jgi:CO/xanthine dehydrogenase FAD-binding subunit
MPAVLLALQAGLRLRSRGGEREVAVTEFLRGPFLTELGERELVTDIAISVPPRGSGSAYVSMEHPASGFALAGAAVLVGPDGETIALTGVGATPFVLPAGDVRNAISGSEIFGDRFASEEYRRELAAVVAIRALDIARERAKEDS